MSHAVMAAAPDLWGSGIDRAASGAVDQALHNPHAADLVELATRSPAALIALGTGLALWLVGDRLFRPAASLIGAVLGALLGLTLSNSMQGQTLAGLPAPYVAIGLGAVLGLAVGAAMYRLAVGGAAAITLAGVAGAIATAVVLHEPGPPPGERPETIAEARAAQAHAEPRIEEASYGEALSLESLKATAADARFLLQSEWQALPEQDRNLVLAASILGCVLGFAIGIIKPRTAGPAIAALAGSALWLGATTLLLLGMSQPTPPLPSRQPGAWLAAWFLVALLGFAVQRRVIRPAALVEKPEAE